MSYAMRGMGAVHGFGAYDPVSAPVFDGCTMNTTKGRTKWPTGWACNKTNFLAAIEASKAEMASDASPTAITFHFVDFMEAMNSGKSSPLPGFPPAQGAPAPAPPPPPSPAPAPPKVDAPTTTPVPSPTTSLMPAQLSTGSSTLKYVIAGGGVLLVLGLVLAKKRRP